MPSRPRIPSRTRELALDPAFLQASWDKGFLAGAAGQRCYTQPAVHLVTYAYGWTEGKDAREQRQ